MKITIERKRKGVMQNSKTEHIWYSAKLSAWRRKLEDERKRFGIQSILGDTTCFAFIDGKRVEFTHQTSEKVEPKANFDDFEYLGYGFEYEVVDNDNE